MTRTTESLYRHLIEDLEQCGSLKEAAPLVPVFRDLREECSPRTKGKTEWKKRMTKGLLDKLSDNLTDIIYLSGVLAGLKAGKETVNADPITHNNYIILIETNQKILEEEIARYIGKEVSIALLP